VQVEERQDLQGDAGRVVRLIGDGSARPQNMIGAVLRTSVRRPASGCGGSDTNAIASVPSRTSAMSAPDESRR